MDAIYIVTGLCTVVFAVGGLILTCHLERRSLVARRQQHQKHAISGGSEDNRVPT